MAIVTYESNAKIKIRFEAGGLLDSSGYVRYSNVFVGDAWFLSIVACWGEGNKLCPPNPIMKGAEPSELVAIDNAWNYAIHQITIGNLSGLQSFQSGYTVKWISDNQAFTNYEIKVWVTGEPEPFKEDYLN